MQYKMSFAITCSVLVASRTCRNKHSRVKVRITKMDLGYQPSDENDGVGAKILDRERQFRKELLSKREEQRVSLDRRLLSVEEDRKQLMKKRGVGAEFQRSE